MNVENNQTYNQFIAALRHYDKKNGYGWRTSVAIDAGLSQGFVSQILKSENAKRPGVTAQEALAKACGHEDLASFLKLGKSLLACEKNPGMKRIGSRIGIEWSDSSGPQGKSSGINQNSNIDAKVGSGMDSNEKDAILRHCLEELAALREEIKYLRDERNKFRTRIDELEKQIKPADPEEKKTAV